MTRIVALIVVALLGLGQAAEVQAQEGSSRPKNVILFISDGCGPASFTLARDYVRDQLKAGDHLTLDEILVGTVRTHSADDRVTDSAAGATALATGHKTYNGAIAVDTLRRPLQTVLEAAKERGKATGLVATTRITHATPASFSAHVPSRNMEAEIAAQQAVAGVDLLFGGGRRFFLPAEAGGSRKDGQDLIEVMRAKGYTVANTLDAFRSLDSTPAVALLAMDQLAYEIDRDSLVEPSLAEMTRRAIDLLSGDPDGFFLMVEGSRIDHAAHGNDAAAHLHDLLAYDRAVAAALEFAKQNGETLVISVSDHETGGLTLGRDGVYAWEPGVLAGVKASADVIAPAMQKADDPEAVLRTYTGIDDLTPDERALLRLAQEDEERFSSVLGTIIGRRASVGWTTEGHTAVDVNLYAFGPGSERLRGNHENTIVGQVIASLLGAELKPVEIE